MCDRLAGQVMFMSAACSLFWTLILPCVVFLFLVLGHVKPCVYFLVNMCFFFCVLHTGFLWWKTCEQKHKNLSLKKIINQYNGHDY